MCVCVCVCVCVCSCDVDVGQPELLVKASVVKVVEAGTRRTGASDRCESVQASLIRVAQ